MQAFTVVILVAGAMLAALLVAVGMASAVHLTSTRQQGYFHLIFYAMLLMVALTQLFFLSVILRPSRSPLTMQQISSGIQSSCGFSAWCRCWC